MFSLRKRTSFKVSISSCFLTGLLDYLPFVSRSKIDSEVIFALEKGKKWFVLQIYHYYGSLRNRITNFDMIYIRIIDPYKVGGRLR